MKLRKIIIPKKETRLFFGVDPGAAGAFAALDQDGAPVFDFCFKDMTDLDIFDEMSPWLLGQNGVPDFCLLERVSSMPKQGVASSFNFGASYGLVRGFIISSRVPWGMVTPSKWQTGMRCKSGGDKSVPLARAQQLFPSVQMNKMGKRQVYDALLVAEYCRRTRLGISFN